MSISPASLTLEHLRAHGWPLVETVERWNPHARIRQDLFGFIDVIAVRRDETLAVQATSLANVAARVRKIGEHPNIGPVREAGWRIVVYGWAKQGRRWTLVREVDCS